MKNDEAGRPMPEAFKDPRHLANTADAMGRLCKSWQGSTAEYHFACRDTIRAQAARIAELEALVAADFDMLDSTWKARAEAAEAEVVRLKKAQTKAATDILAERQRQIGAEGWTPEHDDAHMFGEMATAASSYAAAAGVEAPLRDLIERGKSFPENWPWSKDWWKPTTRRRDLVKAGALIIAEIERLDRAALQPKEGK